jgi:hypothetical protein
MKLTAKTITITVISATIALTAFSSRAQSASKSSEKKLSPATAKREPAGTNSVSKQTAGPFRGKLAVLDKSAKAITVGKRTFHVSSETKIIKGGKPATLEDGVVGEECSGGFKTAEDGKLVATKLTFGPKVDGKAAAEKKSK